MYLLIDRIIPMISLKILNPWSSRLVKNWLSYDLNLFGVDFKIDVMVYVNFLIIKVAKKTRSGLGIFMRNSSWGKTR